MSTILNVYRLEPGDSRFERMYRIFTNLGEAHMFGTLFSHFPILRFIIPEMSGYKAFVRAHRELWNFMEVSEFYRNVINNNSLSDYFTNRYLLMFKCVQNNHERLI